MVIPTFARQALAGEPITVFDDGSQRRCFSHVKDVVTALVGLMGREEAYGEVYNVGATEEISMLELAKRVREVAGSRSEIVTIPYNEAYAEGFEDMRRRLPDTTKVSELLGWHAERDLQAILGDVIESQRSETLLAEGLIEAV
jgi:UDP-glucose 4-epimerase